MFSMAHSMLHYTLTACCCPYQPSLLETSSAQLTARKQAEVVTFLQSVWATLNYKIAATAMNVSLVFLL